LRERAFTRGSLALKKSYIELEEVIDEFNHHLIKPVDPEVLESLFNLRTGH
jgi:hypothetical protein